MRVFFVGLLLSLMSCTENRSKYPFIVVIDREGDYEDFADRDIPLPPDDRIGVVQTYEGRPSSMHECVEPTCDLSRDLKGTATLTTRTSRPPLRYQLYRAQAPRTDAEFSLVFDSAVNAPRPEPFALRASEPATSAFRDELTFGNPQSIGIGHVGPDWGFRAVLTFNPRVPLEVNVTPARVVSVNGGPQYATIGAQPRNPLNTRLGGMNKIRIDRSPTERCTAVVTPDDYSPWLTGASTTGNPVNFVETNTTFEVWLQTPLIRQGRAGQTVVLDSLKVNITCVGADGGVVDAGTTSDAGSDAGAEVDAGTPVDAGLDAGTVVDAGVDAGAPFDAGLPVDAGIPFDAGVPVDAGTPVDAGVPFDAGTPLDAGTPAQVDAGVPPIALCDSRITAATLGPQGRVRSFSSNGTLLASFSPFGSESTGVVIRAVKRGTAAGWAVLHLASGRVTIFDAFGSPVWSAIPLNGTAGSLATCDIDFDGFDDVVFGSRQGVASQVTTILGNGTALGTFAPFGTDTGGVSIACGDTTGDGSPDIVVGPGFGTNNSVRIMNTAGGTTSTFQPFGSTFNLGVNVAVGKVTQALRHHIAVVPRVGVTAVKLFGGNLSELASASPWPQSYQGGASVSFGDITGDGSDEVVVSQLADSSDVRAYTGLTMISVATASFSAFEPAYTGGVDISAAPSWAWNCPPADAGVPDAGFPGDAGSVRDAGLGCTADEGRLVYALPQQAGRVYTRVKQQNGNAYFLTAGNGFAAVYRTSVADGGLEVLGGAVREPTGLLLLDGALLFSDKGQNGMLNGFVGGISLDGGFLGFTQTIASSQDFPVGLAVQNSTDGGEPLLFWPNAGNARLVRANFDGTGIQTAATSSGMTTFTTDATHGYYATASRLIQRIPLDFSSPPTDLISSVIFSLDDVPAMQVVGQNLYVLSSTGGFNARTLVLRMPVTGGPVTVMATVIGASSRHMHVVGNWVYVSESGVAPGCSTYRLWRVPLTAVQAFTVQPVVNSSVPLGDFDIGPGTTVYLREGVWAAPTVP